MHPQSITRILKSQLSLEAFTTYKRYKIQDTRGSGLESWTLQQFLKQGPWSEDHALAVTASASTLSGAELGPSEDERGSGHHDAGAGWQQGQSCLFIVLDLQRLQGSFSLLS